MPSLTAQQMPGRSEHLGGRHIEDYLLEHGVSYQLRHHRSAFTAQGVAETAHVPGSRFAKVVMVLAGGRAAMFVVPAPQKVDLRKAAESLGDSDIRLAQEEEFEGAFADCETGAMPPFGNLYGFPVFVDKSLAHESTIHFQAGSHTETISISFVDFVLLVHPRFGAFIEDTKDSKDSSQDSLSSARPSLLPDFVSSRRPQMSTLVEVEPAGQKVLSE